MLLGHCGASIPILEFLGVCFNVLAFHDHLAKLGGSVRVLFRTDALTAARTLPEESMRSQLLVAAYQMLAEYEEWRQLAPKLSVQHLFGDCNPFSDLASRAKWGEFHQLCRQFGIRPRNGYRCRRDAWQCTSTSCTCARPAEGTRLCTPPPSNTV